MWNSFCFRPTHLLFSAYTVLVITNSACPFLNFSISITRGKLVTKVHYVCTVSHNYINFTLMFSFHRPNFCWRNLSCQSSRDIFLLQQTWFPHHHKTGFSTMPVPLHSRTHSSPFLSQRARKYYLLFPLTVGHSLNSQALPEFNFCFDFRFLASAVFGHPRILYLIII